jgi:hypothetical protein
VVHVAGHTGLGTLDKNTQGAGEQHQLLAPDTITAYTPYCELVRLAPPVEFSETKPHWGRSGSSGARIKQAGLESQLGGSRLVYGVPIPGLGGCAGPPTARANIATVNDLRTWFLIFAFVSIGLEFSLKGLRDAGWRPIAVFASATVVNIVVALGLATVLFGNFKVG